MDLTMHGLDNFQGVHRFRARDALELQAISPACDTIPICSMYVTHYLRTRVDDGIDDIDTLAGTRLGVLTSPLDVRSYIRNSPVYNLLHCMAILIYGVIASLIRYIGRKLETNRQSGESRGKRCRAAQIAAVSTKTSLVSHVFCFSCRLYGIHSTTNRLANRKYNPHQSIHLSPSLLQDFYGTSVPSSAEPNAPRTEWSHTHSATNT